MCGFVIVASAGRGPPPERSIVERMRDTLAHRGPDDATFELVDGWVALGFRRLSIIDVEGARQPLRSEDGEVVCVFNGEIYNFAVLRSRLRALGHTFVTAGDGEVIVHGYEEWGNDVFTRLEGMFAVVLVDRRQRRVVLARDKFGIKPLFYQWDGDQLIAASEIKALLAAPQVSAVASRLALSLGAVRMHVPWPFTAFAGIFRLPPGAVMVLGHGAAPQVSRVIAMTDTPTGEGSPSTPEEALEMLRAAVARQMVADVPVGAFLSGGIDSTLVVALMRESSSRDIHTFSIRTLDHDESGVAAETARELGTTHHTVHLEDITFEDLTDLPRLYDEPFAETSTLGVRALSRFAREYVKVALSGDGGDEVFGGYDSYRWIRTIGQFHVPRAISERARALLTSRVWPPFVRRALRAALLGGGDPARAQRDASTLSWAAGTASRADSERLSELIEAASGVQLETLDLARRAMLADRLERLPNAMLSKVDVASMSASLEVRVPMLDDDVVRYADQLSPSQLIGLRWGKVLLRRALHKAPGGRVAWAKKRGFSLPLDRWMKSDAIGRRMSELFGDHAAVLRELTGENVADVWQAFRTGGSRFSDGTAAMQLLWFATVALWADRFGIRTAVQTSIETAPVV